MHADARYAEAALPWNMCEQLHMQDFEGTLNVPFSCLTLLDVPWKRGVVQWGSDRCSTAVVVCRVKPWRGHSVQSTNPLGMRRRLLGFLLHLSTSWVLFLQHDWADAGNLHRLLRRHW